MKTLTKCFLLLVVLLCSEQILLAQTIKGTVVDAEGKPIELAHVIARKRADSTFVAGCLTDAQGRFAFDRCLRLSIYSPPSVLATRLSQ